MTRAEAIVEIKDLIREREDHRKVRFAGTTDGYRSDIVSYDRATDALRVALCALE